MKVADMHCDTISELYRLQRQGEGDTILDNRLQIDLNRMSLGDYGLQNFALFVHLGREEKPFEYAMRLIDTFYRELEAHSDLIGIVTSFSEISENWKNGRMSALLTVEEGETCQGNLSFLRDFYRLGVRMMTLTWNYENSLGYPNKKITLDTGRTGTVPDGEHGLKETGIAFVREMERLGMIIDVSHLSDAGFWDVLRFTERPFVASHSNARALSSHPRNLTDDMIRALANRGGVMGMNYYCHFLRDWREGEDAESLCSDIVAHMKHVRKVGGIGCLGLGSDFDGIDGRLELDSCAKLPALEREMRRQGFSESEIEAVFFRNVLRVYREVLR